MDQLSERRAALFRGCETGGQSQQGGIGWMDRTEEPILAEVKWSQRSSLRRVGSRQQPA